jgi:uncharacterized protein HemX
MNIFNPKLREFLNVQINGGSERWHVPEVSEPRDVIGFIGTAQKCNCNHEISVVLGSEMGFIKHLLQSQERIKHNLEKKKKRKKEKKKKRKSGLTQIKQKQTQKASKIEHHASTITKITPRAHAYHVL